MPSKEIKLPYIAIESQVKFLQGKVLTIVDASYGDSVQRKAVKDLINSSFSQQMNWIGQLCFPEVMMMSRDGLKAQGIDVEKVEKEAIEINGEKIMGIK